MAYIEWWNRTGPITMGERFGLNEISTRAKTLSPIKSYTEGGRIGFEDGSKKGKPFIDPKRVKLEKILSELPKGSTVDTGKLMDRTGVDSTRMTRLLQKYEKTLEKIAARKNVPGTPIVPMNQGRGRDEPSRPSPSRSRDRGRSRSSGETGQISGGHHFNYGGIVSVL